MLWMFYGINEYLLVDTENDMNGNVCLMCIIEEIKYIKCHYEDF